MIKGEKSIALFLFNFYRMFCKLAVGVASLPLCDIFPQAQIDNAIRKNKISSAEMMKLHNLFEQASDPTNPLHEKAKSTVSSYPGLSDPTHERDLDHEKKIHDRYQKFA